MINRREWLAAGLAGLTGCGNQMQNKTSDGGTKDGAAAFTVDEDGPSIGGQRAIVLRRRIEGEVTRPTISEVEILPGRGFNIWQVRGLLPGRGRTDLFAAPSLDEAARLMNGGENDFRGNENFKNGGAILLPYANRIRGKLRPKEQLLETRIAGKPVLLPSNWKGKNPGAEPHAMHGLILDQPLTVTRRQGGAESAVLEAELAATDFAGKASQGASKWPGRVSVRFQAKLSAKGFELQVITRNEGSEPLPLGVGWHPYFNLPSGDRKQARLKIPAASRALVDNYDNVFPTGAVEPVAGTRFDFREPRPLGEQFLDDCFLDLSRNADTSVSAEIQDPAAHYSVKVSSQSPAVKAFQCYAPPDKPFVVLEPQYNLGDPYSAVWKGRDTGMVLVAPGAESVYDATLEVFAL